MDSSFKIGNIGGLDGLPLDRAGKTRSLEGSFADSLKQAVRAVDELQHDSEAAQISYANNEDVELHDVLIKIEEAEIAFKTMMEVRNKLIEAYREVMRMGS